MRELELLAPARNCEIGIDAIRHGADAVYIGATSHGARSAASNSIEDIARLVDYAHKFYAKVYVTLNTLIFDDELKAVEELIGRLYRINVDALIIQDTGILMMDIPPIALHASTQCDIRNLEKALFYEKLGFSQIVLPREMNFEEISEIASALKIPVEVFVHGALCVSYSGDCRAGQLASGRSGNRGECPQICRLPFNLVDEDGTTLISGRHLLSLHDLNRIKHLSALVNSGVSSFKIEGRLKDDSYVRNTVAAYRVALDKIIDTSDGKIKRSSQGDSTFSFVPDLAKSFNRGYTDYIHTKYNNRQKFAQTSTPKMIGEEIGEVKNLGDKFIEIKSSKEINNGDGIAFFAKNGSLEGFRVNRVKQIRLFYAGHQPSGLTPGVKIYRNFDKKWEDIFTKETASRRIEVSIELRYNVRNNLITSSVCDNYNNTAVLSRYFKADIAATSQETKRKEIFSKLGNTIWILKEYTDKAGEYFIPVSIIGEVKRDLLILLENTRNATRKVSYRRPQAIDDIRPYKTEITARDNVVNRKAEQLYRQTGFTYIEKGIEKNKDIDLTKIPVMECRYCIRREIGECKRKGSKIKGNLYLTNSHGLKYRLEFDCVDCIMRLYAR